MKQLSFDAELYSFTGTDPIEKRITYSNIRAGQATFKNGLVNPAHRWFRLTPSFGPDLVGEMLVSLRAEEGDLVLDPFAGAGTTVIECKLRGIDSLGFEINPFLQWVGGVCLNWHVDPEAAQQTLGRLIDEFQGANGCEPNAEASEMPLPIPPIHNPFRWWRPDVLRELLQLKKSIYSVDVDEVREFFKLALAAVLVPDLTNVTLGKLQLHFIDRSLDIIDVLGTFVKHAQKMIDDLQNLSGRKVPSATILLQDATDLARLSSERRVNCVITSPPYPNRYSYVWNTRPHLYFLDFMQTPKEATVLDLKTIGGTWGTATSCLQKGVIEPDGKAVGEIISPLVEKIRASDNLMANYVMKYFNSLSRQILAMESVLAADARIAYVVGCSEIKGVYVETDVLLGKILEGLGVGYKVRSIERFRKRNSGVNLHESIVYAWKNGES
jgi:hypothetical protein